MATFRVTKAKRVDGFTLGSLQRCLTGVSESELRSSPTLKRICEIVQEGLAESPKCPTATSASLEQVLEVFDLVLNYDDEGCLGDCHEWDLGRDLGVEDSVWLDYGLHIYQKLFTTQSEATCRTVLDLILLDRLARVPNSSVMNFQDYADRHHKRHSKSSRNPTKPPSDESREKSTLTDKSTLTTPTKPPKSAMPSTPPSLVPSAGGHDASLKAYGEVYMSLKVKGIRCTGRADYAIGYGASRNMLETLFVIIEAKSGASLLMAKAVSQTLFYLGILRSERRRAGKKNTTVYGVCSDGKNFKFIRVNENSEVQLSAMFELDGRAGRKKIIAYIHHILNNCVKYSPTSSPTKDICKMEAEVGDYENVVGRVVFRLGSGFLELEEVDEEWIPEEVF